jgi:hypothetical protein
MPFFDAISRFFGFDRDPTVGKWPRPVGTNELPPERIPIIGYNQPLPFGIREVSGPNHQGWQPWRQRQQQEDATKEFNRYLRDGGLPAPGQK